MDLWFVASIPRFMLEIKPGIFPSWTFTICLSPFSSQTQENYKKELLVGPQKGWDWDAGRISCQWDLSLDRIPWLNNLQILFPVDHMDPRALLWISTVLAHTEPIKLSYLGWAYIYTCLWASIVIQAWMRRQKRIEALSRRSCFD